MPPARKKPAAKVPDHPALIDGSFAHLPLGRSRVHHDPLTIRLASYLDDEVLLPEIPDACDWTAGVEAWPMYGNDKKGDCTIADAGHQIQAWTNAAGELVTPDEAAILEAYIPGTGTEDTGRVEVDVLNYWRKTGIAGHKIDAFAYVDPQNLDHIRAAIYLFGGVYTGVALPITAQGQQVWDVVGDGKTGDSAPGSWGGHAVPWLAYFPASTASEAAALQGAGFKTVTWGGVLLVTEAFHLAYCDELYVPISRDFLKDGKTPAGFDLDALLADVGKIGKLQAEEPQALEHDASGAHEAPDPHEAIEQIDPDELRAEVDAGSPGYYWEG